MRQHRPVSWPRIACTSSLLLAIPVGIAYYLLASAFSADALRLHFDGVPADNKIVVLFVKGNDSSGASAPGNDYQGYTLDHIPHTSYFKLLRCWAWVKQMTVVIPSEELASLHELTITIGDREPYHFSAAEVRTWERHPQADRVKGANALQVPAGLYRSSRLPWIGQTFLNWPGDNSYLRSVATYSLFPCLVVLLGSFLSRRGVRYSEPRGSSSPAALWNWLGVAFLAGAFTMLEVRDRYYFCQDDSLVESLPTILVGCRSVFGKGEFPDYNAYLGHGVPLANLGMYALTYPPTYIAYVLARYVLRDEYATLDVFAILHLTIGFFATRRLGQKIGMGALPANLVALSCVLSGSALITGAAWFNFTPAFAWLPILFLGLVRLQRGPITWWWILTMGLAMGLTFHIGFPQLAIYLNGFVCLGVFYLVLVGAMPRRRALAMLPALLIGAGVAMPLVYQQWLVSQGVQRSGASGQGIGRGLAAMLLPYPLVEAKLPAEWGNERLQLMGHFYFFGGLFAFLWAFEVVGWVAGGGWRVAGEETRKDSPPATHSSHLWTFLALIAFWLGLGDIGGLWLLVSHLPVIGFINRQPMRLMPFVVFFACLSGGLILERFLCAGSVGREAWGVGRRFLRPLTLHASRSTILGGSALLLLLFHVYQCRTAFYLHEPLPYPPLPQKLRDIFWKNGQLQGRVASWAPLRAGDADYFRLMPLNLPAVYELPTMEFYNPIIMGKRRANDTVARKDDREVILEALRIHGTRWHFCRAPGTAPPLSSVQSQSWMYEVVTRNDPLYHLLVPERLHEVFNDGDVLVTEVPSVDPLAFPVGHRDQQLPIYLHGWGIEVDVSRLDDKERKVIVNFMYYPEMEVSLDGRRVQFGSDAEDRIIVSLPRPGQTLQVRYSPPWAKGIWWGLILAAVGSLSAWRYLRRIG